MGGLGMETRSLEVKNFLAGEFPTLPETGTAATNIDEYTPITKNDDGGIVPVTAETIGDVIGITVEKVDKDEPIVYFMTGEFFTEAINIPEGIEKEALKEACRKLSIFLRD